MKFFLYSLCLIAFLSAPAAAQNGKYERFYDFLRQGVPYDNPKLTAKETRMVLNSTLGPNWKKKKLNPTIDGKFVGSFTAAGVQETAYVVRGGQEPSSTIDMQNGGRLVIFSGDKVVLNVKFDGAGILRTSDLNQDGIHELTLFSSWFFQGEDGAAAELVQVQGKRLKTIKDFGTVEQSTCENDDAENVHIDSNSYVTAIILHEPLTPGKFPKFRTDYFRGPCPGADGKINPKKFRFVQSNKFPE